MTGNGALFLCEYSISPNTVPICLSPALLEKCIATENFEFLLLPLRHCGLATPFLDSPHTGVLHDITCLLIFTFDIAHKSRFDADIFDQPNAFASCASRTRSA